MSDSLSSLMRYTNDTVVAQFCHRFPEYSFQQAQLLFQDLLAWLWFRKQRTREKKNTYLFGPLLIMDELWHIFILHTRDYVDFSNCYFGGYVHHDPEPIGFEHVLSEEELADYLEDCFKYLDQQWIERRFASAFTDLV